MDEYVTNLRAEQSCRLGSEAIIGDWFDVDRVEGQLCWVTKLVRFTTADEGGRENYEYC